MSEMIPTIIYILCALTCLGAAILLWRGYRRSRQPLLYWSALCFAILAVSNGLLIVDLVILPSAVSLLLWRSGVSQVALLVLLYGLIFESD
jgi:cytochrome bd-type quinol oxidase subunit 2